MSIHTPPFVHLHVHSEYSLLDGAIALSELPRRAAEMEMPAIALSDHGVMYGAVDFYRECEEVGIKPIIGCEVYVARRTRFDRDPRKDRSAYHLVLLAENLEGYRNLVKLASLASLEGHYYNPRVDLELLTECADGLICLSGCLQGQVPQLLTNGDGAGARQVAGQYREIFGPDNYFIELQDHGIEQQREVLPGLIEVAQDLDIPLVATNDAHYLRREERRYQDVLLCIGTNSCVNDEKRMRMEGEEFYLKSAEEMAQLFPDHPEALSNTAEIAERCEVELELGTLRLPHYDVPEGHTLDTFLRERCLEGVHERYGCEPEEAPPEVLERLDYELDVIRQKNYSGYFLIVADLCNEAQRRDMLIGPGRGSATGSMVGYTLGITQLDPIEHGLIFERMLNPDRESPPDIDLDFPDDRRHEIIEFCKERWGENHVAQVITFNTLGARAAIRDVGRALDVDLDRVDRLAKLVPGGTTIEEAVEAGGELARLSDQEPELAEVLNTARHLEGLSRHCSVHAAAVVVSDEPLMQKVPLKRDEDETMPVTQYSMKPVEDVGLVKIDFLGLKTLQVVSNTIRLVRQRHGVEIDPLNMSLDDPDTYEMLSKGETDAVFQLESEGMRRILRQLKPNNFQHIIQMIALYRPGPMQFADELCERRHGAEVTYPHEDLRPILEETYGIILYQEQVMRTASELAGFSMPQAELIMRAMAKKRQAQMEQMKPLFIEGCVNNGIDRACAEDIFQRMETFSNYGFNKSHSTGYALVVYWTAYLKANYPAEYMASHLTTVMDSSEDVAKYVTACQRAMGLEVLPPSVNVSDAEFSVNHEGAITYGLAAIKNVGHSTAEAICRERNDNGAFNGLSDFCARMPSEQMQLSTLETLIEAGAFDEFGDRAALLAAAPAAHSAGKQRQTNMQIGQDSLFGGSEELEQMEGVQLPDVPPMPDQEKLRLEKELLGVWVSENPLQQAAEKIEQCTNVRLAELTEFPDGHEVVVGGIIRSFKEHTTRNGDQMCFFTLGDFDSEAEVTVFPRLFSERSDIIENDNIVIVTAKLELKTTTGAGGEEMEEARLLANRISLLPNANTISEQRIKDAQQAREGKRRRREEQRRTANPTRVEICLRPQSDADAVVEELRQAIYDHPGIQPITIRVPGPDGDRAISLGQSYTVDGDNGFTAAMQRLGWVEGVRVIRN